MRLVLAAMVGLAVAWSASSFISAQGSVTVSGRGFDPGGGPSAGTDLVFCTVSNFSCELGQTDTDGRFEFEASRGSWRIGVVHPLGGGGFNYFDGGEGNLSWDHAEFTTIEIESTSVSGIEMRLPTVTEVSGILRRADGSPQAIGLISICRLRSGSCFRDTTDDDGTFSFSVPRDRYWIEFPGSTDIERGVYDPGAPGGFSTSLNDPAAIVVRATPITGIEITLPAPSVKSQRAISGRLTYSSGTPIAGAEVRVCPTFGSDCRPVSTDDAGKFRLALPFDIGRFEIRIHSGGVSGFYSESSLGSFSESEADSTVLMIEDDSVRDLEISIPLPNRVSGYVRWPDGSPASDTRVSVCRSAPEQSCSHQGVWLSTQTGPSGRFTIDVPSGDHYVSFTIQTNERWYYHRDSEGHLINTGRRPERSFISVPSAEAVDLQVWIPRRNLVEILVSDAHRGAADGTSVQILTCRTGWDFASFLPQCLMAIEDAPLDSGVRRARLPLPDERHYLRFDLIGYALPDRISWYYDQDSPSGLTNDFTRASMFSNDNPSPSTLSVSLPDLPRTIPITLQLRPGANLVGWPGGTISLSELARQLPALKGVVSIPRHPSLSPQAYPVGHPDAPDLQTFSLWWFYVALDEPTTVEIESPGDRERQNHSGYPISEGTSLIVWAGPQTVTLEDASAGLGELRTEPRLLRWTGTRVEYLDSGSVRPGDIIQIDSPRRSFAQLPSPVQPYFVLQGQPDKHWEHLQQRLADVRSFFWEEYGVQRNDVIVYYRPSTVAVRFSDPPEGQCGSGHTRITLVCGESHAVAKYYFSSLQWNMSSLLISPGWLIEGAREYAAARFLQHEQEGRGDPLSLHRVAARNDTEEYRTLSQLHVSLQHWGDDPSATRLSALAVDWLVRQTNEPDSLIDVFRRVSDYYLTADRSYHDWERAFEQTFGISVDDFYERFAEYRANGFQLDDE